MTKVKIHTVLHLRKGIFERLRFFLKIPPSDLRQKVHLIPYNVPYEEIAERWTTIHKFVIPFSAFQLEQYNQETIFETPDLTGKTHVITTVLDINIVRQPYRISTNIQLNQLSDIWSEKSFVNDYLDSYEFVESTEPEIIDLANEIIDEINYFWTAVEKIANWVNLHIVYDHAMREKPYQGALNTLKTRKAICADFVHLFIALTKAVNIPSRAVNGIAKLTRSGRWDSHSWCEVYDPKFGWTPIDLTVQPINVGGLGAYYIKRSAGYNCADRLCAFYTDQEEATENAIDLTINQQVILDHQSVNIPFQR